MRWAPQDWLSSSLRGQLAMEGDHLARMVYRELLDKLHECGGRIKREHVAGAVLVKPEEADRALDRLLQSGSIVEQDGLIWNPRVLEDLERAKQFSEEQAQLGRRGGLAKAKRSLSEPLAYPRTTKTEPKPAVSVAVTNAVSNTNTRTEVTAPPKTPRELYCSELWAQWVKRRGGAAEPPWSSAEWDLACQWHDAGIPLRIVLRGLAECNGAKGAAKPLQYYRPAVDEAVARWRKATA